ncbi:MAG: MBL fold metallo-hydrolase [Armatimonadota bacterium]|nr:MBL fold metallo-hydrolase [Armatimonadota bacterium]MDR7450134.1 MBL fold metallo-hydrolase [Armatimonadota bacterium]MDR7460618.1 MBL fold metallo-hydrolase [Armatimonadota bacterium]MDR7480845.1 MBL fold metallo-hydrolase [Armatimonadota bacterium]MDR7489514.1 MBL fold metallo-hydrolase [Armatimonadota bacterium]
MRIARLHVLDILTPSWHPRPNTLVSNYAYLVISSAGVLLFDTGLGPPHSWIDDHCRPKRYDLVALLREKGVLVSDVDVVVNCHLHFDHCGGNHLFKGARFVVQRTELEEARTPNYTVREWFDFTGARFEIADGEHEIWAGATVFPTPGHTMGHQSLILDSPKGIVVLAGQAAESPEGFEEGTGSWEPDRQDIGAASIARLKAMSPTRVMFAHDASEWRRG